MGPGRPPRRGWLLAGLLALGFLLRLAVSLRPLQVVDDLAVPDDAYLSLTLARNIARGLGPLYGLDPTNGFQPLYVFLMAPAFRLWPDDPHAPLRVAFVLLALCDALALLLMVRWLRRVSEWRWTPELFGLCWALSPYAVLTALNGLETALSFCLLVAVLDRLSRWRAAPALASARRGLAFGALLGLAALARVDNLLLWPVVALVLIGTLARREVPAPALARWVAAAGVAAVGVILPWLLYSWSYTGQLFPVSGRAVRYWALTRVDHNPTWGNFYWPMVRQAADVVLRKQALHLALGAVVLAGLAWLRPRVPARTVARRLGELWPMALFGALLFAAYTGFVFGYWHLPRYLFPLSLVFGFAAFTLLDVLAARLEPGGTRRALAALALLLVVAGNVVQPAFQRLFSRRLYGTWGYMRVGEWARDRFVPGTRIGGSQTGALGYFGDSLVVVNLDGVVNRACYEALRRKLYWPYIRSTGIEYIVWQDDIGLVARESRDFDPRELEFVETVPGVRTWGEGWYVYRVVRPPPGPRP